MFDFSVSEEALILREGRAKIRTAISIQTVSKQQFLFYLIVDKYILSFVNGKINAFEKNMIVHFFLVDI